MEELEELILNMELDDLLNVIGVAIGVILVSCIIVKLIINGFEKTEKPKYYRRRNYNRSNHNSNHNRKGNGVPAFDNWVSTEDFENAKRNIHPNCSDADLQNFINFLRGYKGGYVRRSHGRIIMQDYLGKEKGDLKWVFFNIVVPNHNISITAKEEFRTFLRCIGVNGIEKRPDYETRDSKLKNNKTGEDYYRKEVGNIGEQIVRDTLKLLEPAGYSIINGAVLKNGNTTVEYDHIVIGRSGVFCIETKAFGLSNGESSKAALFIDKGDKWIIRKKQVNKDLNSPTQQILKEKEHLEKILSATGAFTVRPIVVLCNTELYIKNNITLPYDVLRVDFLNEHIKGYVDTISSSDKWYILSEIEKCRVN